VTSHTMPPHPHMVCFKLIGNRSEINLKMPDQTRHGVPVVNTDIQIPEKNQAVRWSTLQFSNKTVRLSSNGATMNLTIKKEMSYNLVNLN